ncbi:hypothetical protein RCK47_24055, partial [Salmonella enterica subsp. enterica serovar Derby]
ARPHHPPPAAPHQHGVVGHDATYKCTHESSDQRAAADGGAAGISIAAGKREIVLASFHQLDCTRD